MLIVSYTRDNSLWLTFPFVVEQARPSGRISHAYNNPFVTESYVTICTTYVNVDPHKFAGKRNPHRYAITPKDCLFKRSCFASELLPLLRLMIAPGPHLTGSQIRNVTRVFSLLTNQGARRIVCSAFCVNLAL